MFTRYSHYQDHEIIRQVLNSPKPSELELELARRLSDTMDERDEYHERLCQWNPYMRQQQKDSTPKPKYVGDA